MFKVLNKKISTLTGIIIIVLFSLLAGSIVTYQYKLLLKEISAPPVFLFSPLEETH